VGGTETHPTISGNDEAATPNAASPAIELARDMSGKTWTAFTTVRSDGA
jgi:hypothetical protein